MSKNIRDFRELRAYDLAMGAAMEIFRLTSQFPREEKYSLVDQVRRASRSVCANIAEAWRKRRYRGAFVAKLNDAESEAAETQVWLDFSGKCGYMAPEEVLELRTVYDHIISSLVRMVRDADNWIIRTTLDCLGQLTPRNGWSISSSPHPRVKRSCNTITPRLPFSASPCPLFTPRLRVSASPRR